MRKMSFQTSKLNEDIKSKIYLDNKEVSAQEFNETLDNLKPNQRILESQNNSFHIIERFRD